MKTVFYLMRHAESDYSGPGRWNAPGWGGDLAPLSEKGKEQATLIISKIKEINPDILLASPTARTLETALHIVAELPLKFAVEFDLHEWVPDVDFSWRTLEEVLEIQNEFDLGGGEHPADTEKSWETFSMIRKRVLNVFEKYAELEKVFVVCHGMVMRALTGKEKIENTEILEYQID